MLEANTVAGPVLPKPTSACGVTVVRTMELDDVPLLLFVFESGVGDVLNAMFVSVPVTGAVSVTVKFVVAPPGKFTASHTMTLLLME